MKELKDFAGLILAAGLGKRLRTREDDTYPKVLREINGRPMIAYVIDAMRGAGIADICVVVGAGADTVRSVLGDEFIYARQQRQIGSGDAAASSESCLKGVSQHIVVMCGDSPLFTSDTVSGLMTEHLKKQAVATLAVAELDDPFGYGRIIRTDGRITAVVEEKCASAREKAIEEVNGGCYVFDSNWLWSRIHSIQPNETGEYCLTDVVGFAISDGLTVASFQADPDELIGVNTPEQLREAEAILRRRIPMP